MNKIVKIVLISLAVLFVIGAISGNKPTASVPAAAITESSKPAVIEQPVKKEPQTLLDISGSGIKSSQTFTTSGDWDISYTYDCSNFGYAGIFQVMVYTKEGILSDLAANQSGMSGAETTYMHKAGTYYLEVNSTCDWTVQIKG
jgi:hypothetical protein